MEAKWPFFILLLAILGGIGYAIACSDRDGVINDWENRRCELPIMVAGSFFKPDNDPRTKSEFSSANFEFCMKSHIEKFMAVLMAPVHQLFEKNVAIAGSSVDAMDRIRGIATTLFNGFSSYLEKFYRRFNASVFEISKVMQFLRMAMRRISGVAMSLIYIGLSVYNGIISAIQFIIKVILIICGIMLVLMIILFFILFPVIPIILYTLGVIVKTVLSLSGVMDPGVAAEANDKKSGFCLAEWTMITVLQNGQAIQKSVKDIAVGDKLEDGGYITATIHMDGTDVQLYQIGNVAISGSHLVKGTDSIWKSVTMDERAVKIDRTSATVYCFNTTTNVIPVDGLYFRDWEEIANDDEKGQMIWNYMVSRILNTGKPFTEWKDNLKNYVNIAVVSSDMLVKTTKGLIPIKDIRLGDYVVDQNDEPHKVRGVVQGEVEYDKDKSPQQWTAELYEYRDDIWIKGRASIYPGIDVTEGISLITENGEFIICDSGKEIRVRDFTEVGHKTIYKTYSYVDARLRMKE